MMHCSKRYNSFILLFHYQDLPEADYTETPEELSCEKQIKEGLSVVISLMIVHTQINRPFDT